MDVGGIILGLVLAIAWAESVAWLPALTRRIVRAAARRLEPDLRSRMEEEWLRHVEDTPGALGPLLAACQCMVASTRILPVRLKAGLPRRLPASNPLSSRLFGERDLFVHDGKTLRRFRVAARVQAFALVILMTAVAWAGYETTTYLVS